MARIRTIKPELWSSEQFVDCSLEARLLFIGTWNFADDHGVLKFRARTIKSNVFPEDEAITSDVIRRLIVELVKNGLVGVFEAQGVEYLHILGFEKHQRIDKPTFKHPHPPKNPAGYKDWSSIDRRPTADLFDDRSPPEGKGMESNGREIDSVIRRSVDEEDETDDVDAWFDDWYARYPRKVAKGAARKAFASVLKHRKVTLAELLAATDEFASSVVDKDPEYIPHPATWLNSERWADHRPAAPSQAADAGATAVREPDLLKLRLFFASPVLAADGETVLRWVPRPADRRKWVYGPQLPTDSDFPIPRSVVDRVADELGIPPAEWPRGVPA